MFLNDVSDISEQFSIFELDVDFSIAGFEFSESAGFSSFELTLEDFSVDPLEPSVSLFDVVDVLAVVLASVGPFVESLSVHFSVDEGAFVGVFVGPGVEAHACDAVVFELAFVCVLE